jgi:hypothetical protein
MHGNNYQTTTKKNNLKQLDVCGVSCAAVMAHETHQKLARRLRRHRNRNKAGWQDRGI